MANRVKRVPNSKESAPLTRLKKFGSQLNYQLKPKEKYKKTVIFIERKPFASFFIALGILLLAILLGSTIFRVQSPEVATRTEPKRIEVFKLGENASLNVQGEIKKSGVVKIVAQTPGIVKAISKKEGDYVKKGESIISLSSNYQGGNAASLQRQLAALTYQNTKETYEIQKELIKKQRDLTNTQSQNSEKLRELIQISVNDTRDLLNLNTEIIDQIKSNIQTLQNNNADPSDILALQQVLSQVQSGTNQLSSSLRANEYQLDANNEPQLLENLGKEIAFRQLDLQEKALETSLKAAGISLELSRVMEANMYPAAPFSGIIEKIHVKEGQSVNPGQILVTFKGDSGGVTVDVLVSKDIAERVSKITPATIYTNNKSVNQLPIYISTEATKGQLYSVIFAIDKEYESYFTEDGFVNVNLPVGYNITSKSSYIPLDSVFQTQDEAYVFIVENNVARSRKVKLGEVIGGFVNVTEGLSGNETIILTRTVIEGDKVTF